MADLGLRYYGPWHLELDAIAPPSRPVGDDVVVEIRAVGICGTDLGIVSGLYPSVRPPVILGHEAAGVIAAVGEKCGQLVVGDRVVIDPTYFCGECPRCLRGHRNHCVRKQGTEMGVSADGALRRFCTVPAQFIHPIGPDLPFEHAVLCEPLSCVLTASRSLVFDEGLKCLILGAGPIGLLFAHVLAANGQRGWIVEAAPERWRAAEPAVPAGWALHRSVTLIQQAVRPAITGWDIVIDTAGAANTVVDSLAPGGQVLFVALSSGELRIDPATIADRSLRLVGSIDSLGSFEHAVDLVRRGSFPIKLLQTHSFPLQQYETAFRLLGCDISRRCRTPPGAALKVVLLP